jgi:hypothetical protein
VRESGLFFGIIQSFVFIFGRSCTLRLLVFSRTGRGREIDIEKKKKKKKKKDVFWRSRKKVYEFFRGKNNNNKSELK